MPHFYHEQEHYYLTTNFKVMYSTLKEQEAMHEVHPVPLIQHGLAQKVVPEQATDHYLLVRNPYDRLESFYRDKFQRTDKVYQDCIRIFYPMLGLEEADEFETIKERLRDVSFSEFMELLPELYHKDPHLTPQHWERDIFRNYMVELPLEFETIIKIDDHQNDDRLADDLKIDLERIGNVTKHMEVEVQWDQSAIATVNKIYVEDFERYGYEISPVG